MGQSQRFPSLKSFCKKVEKMFCRCGTPNRYEWLDAKLEEKLVEIKRSSTEHSDIKSINSIIMKFPQFKEELKKIRGVFDQFDEDSNGNIDFEELKRCIHKLQLHFSDSEIHDLFHSCDLDESQGIQFNEFIVLLCLIYLLKEPSSSDTTSTQLGATFDPIIDVFLFLDKSGSGKLDKNDMIKALNEASPTERSPARITRTRFREMDWDRNGKISFREFLFAFIHWVGLDADEEIRPAET